MTGERDINTWWHRAACVDSDPRIFEQTQNFQDWTEAKATCRRCPVRDDCLRDALAGHEYLFRAGLPPSQINHMRYAR